MLRQQLCWESGPDTEDHESTTCLLPAGHDGPHEWMRDSEMVAKWPPPPTGELFGGDGQDTSALRR